MVYVVLCPGAREGSTSKVLVLKRSQKTEPPLKDLSYRRRAKELTRDPLVQGELLIHCITAAHFLWLFFGSWLAYFFFVQNSHLFRLRGFIIIVNCLWVFTIFVNAW